MGYRVIELSNATRNELQDQLAQAGSEGWELVSTNVFCNLWMTRIVSRLFLRKPRL